jgi:hypothetical protein
MILEVRHIEAGMERLKDSITIKESNEDEADAWFCDGPMWAV